MSETSSVIRSQPASITSINETTPSTHSDKGFYKDFCVSCITNPSTIFCGGMSSAMGATASFACTKAFGLSAGLGSGFGVASGIAAVFVAKPIINCCCGDTNDQTETNIIDDQPWNSITTASFLASSHTSDFIFETTV